MKFGKCADFSKGYHKF